jgi:pimeloyl-ACP methyl ester carboxylesterase
MRIKSLLSRLFAVVVTALACALQVPAAWCDQPAVAIRHPQDEAIAKGPRPYTNHDVSFVNERAHIKLAGTLALPDGKGPFPAALLIAASGPEGRDEDVAGHHVFVVLADYLLRRGIAVLRYDKRGVGQSAGDLGTASFDDLVSDAAVAFDFLKAHPGIDARRTGLIGHSEGGSIAPAVARDDRDVGFIVTLAGSGLSGEVRITELQAYLAQERGASTEQQNKIRTLCRSIFQTVAATHDDVSAASKIAALVDESVKADVLTTAAGAQLKQVLTPGFVRQELADNPVKYLGGMHSPMLALVGSLDRMVPAGPYVAMMQPVLEKIPGSKVQVLPGLNHVMQTAWTGSPREFATIEESISPVALQVIGDWVTERTSAAQKR